MPTEKSISSLLARSKNLSPDSKVLLKQVLEKCPKADLDLLDNIIRKCDEKVGRMKQKLQHQKTSKILNTLYAW